MVHSDLLHYFTLCDIERENYPQAQQVILQNTDAHLFDIIRWSPYDVNPKGSTNFFGSQGN